MKRLVSLLILLSLVYFSGYGQKRHVDLDVAMLLPIMNDVITINNDFDVEVRMLNLGPDTLRSTDTLYVSLKFDTGTILFQVGSNIRDYVEETGYEIVPGDSAKFGLRFGIGTGWDTGLTRFCVRMIPVNSVDTLVEDDSANNSGCNDVLIRDEPNTVESVIDNITSVSLYPNPATTETTLEFSLADNAEIKMVIRDILGRAVQTKDLGLLQKGKHKTQLDLSGLAPGNYFYLLSANSGITTGKLFIR